MGNKFSTEEKKKIEDIARQNFMHKETAIKDSIKKSEPHIDTENFKAKLFIEWEKEKSANSTIYNKYIEEAQKTIESDKTIKESIMQREKDTISERQQMIDKLSKEELTRSLEDDMKELTRIMAHNDILSQADYDITLLEAKTLSKDDFLKKTSAIRSPGHLYDLIQTIKIKGDRLKNLNLFKKYKSLKKIKKSTKKVKSYRKVKKSVKSIKKRNIKH